MKKYMFVAAAVLTLAACGNDVTLDDVADGPLEIRLANGLEVQTRAAHNLDDQLGTGLEVHVWVDEVISGDDPAGLYVNNKLMTNGDGTLSVTGEGEDMYYPVSGNNVNIYALHGTLLDGELSDEPWTVTDCRFTVASDQTSSAETDAGAPAYAASDLAFAIESDVKRTRETVNLTFQHQLSKIEVVLLQGTGNPEITKMEILNTKLSGEFQPSKDDVSYIGETMEPCGDTGPIAVDCDITDKSAVEDGNEDNIRLNEAIVIPQTLTAGTQFIKVTTGDGAELYYTLEEDTAFEYGKRYRYILTANAEQQQLTITSTIEGWTWVWKSSSPKGVVD